jgi:hypothetical protein
MFFSFLSMSLLLLYFVVYDAVRQGHDLVRGAVHDEDGHKERAHDKGGALGGALPEETDAKQESVGSK